MCAASVCMATIFNNTMVARQKGTSDFRYVFDPFCLVMLTLGIVTDIYINIHVIDQQRLENSFLSLTPSHQNQCLLTISKLRKHIQKLSHSFCFQLRNRFLVGVCDAITIEVKWRIYVSADSGIAGSDNDFLLVQRQNVIWINADIWSILILAIWIRIQIFSFINGFDNTLCTYANCRPIVSVSIVLMH